MIQKKTMILAGGGTGGHVVPVFELYKKLKEINNLSLIVIGGGTIVEKDFFKDNPDYRTIRAGKFHRHITVKHFGQFFNFLTSLFQTLFIILCHKPDLIFIKGGYVSLPVAIWARILHIPYIIHESDLEMGAANKFSAKGAKKIFVGFPEKHYKNIDKNKIVFSGQIIRKSFLTDDRKNYELFDFDKNKKTILITGGSQGSANINENSIEVIPKLLKRYNIIHQTGAFDYKKILKFKISLDSDLSKNYFIRDFLKEEGETDWMLLAINLADVVVARAGANTVAELSAKGKVMILIPYRHAAGDHQTKNAEILAECEAAIIIKDEGLNPEVLQKKIDLAFLPENFNELGKRAVNIFPLTGLETVSKYIIELLENKETK